MTRGQSKKGADKTKARLAQTPENQLKKHGEDVEFSQEFADHDDMEAQERAKAADERAQQRNK